MTGKHAKPDDDRRDRDELTDRDDLACLISEALDPNSVQSVTSLDHLGPFGEFYRAADAAIAAGWARGLHPKPDDDPRADCASNVLFLRWVYNRLFYKYAESPNEDHMRRLKRIAWADEPDSLAYALGGAFTPAQVDLITGGEPAAAPEHEHEWIYAGGMLERAGEWCKCGETRNLHGPVWQDRNPRPPGQPERCRCGEDACGRAS